MAAEDSSPADARQYRVLARKYRPTNFAELIGQEAMVRTLTNAIHSGRLAHAFVLTGVRGVGKTTTARIIARALNCERGPTPDPCGVCDHCRAIAEDRHMDVIEMDAASRTGIDDIREVIEGVRYRPVSARYKVYIVDEVHMLSKSAFNALLKTLEEPPEHVKFIFATTEIRKVPVTVLSRCQRFDLRRIELGILADHFRGIAIKEGAEIEEGALQLVARAADGSVRDGLSLLDQAIAHTAGKVTEEQVRDMLGLADRTLVFDLFDAVMKGDAKGALDQMARQYAAGADPGVVLTDLLELTHWLTRIKVAPSAADAPGVPEAERVRGRDMASRLPMAAVSRAWQMLLKGLSEVRQAPSPQQAAEMALVRLAYAADLPTPAEALQALKDKGSAAFAGSATGAAPSQAAAGHAPPPITSRPGPPPDAPRALMSGTDARPMTAEPVPGTAEALPDPRTFKAVVDLASEKREGILHANLLNNLHLVAFEPGRIEFRPGDRAPADLAQTLKKFLDRNTGRRWMVMVSNVSGEATLAQQDAAADASLRAKAAETPVIRAILEIFPGAQIRGVREAVPEQTSDMAAADLLPPSSEEGMADEE
jgi:DNA polymerase-3 subunit gamma/tau